MINVSEGRDLRLIERLASQAGSTLLDVHSDASHHRSVLTLAGIASEVEESAKQVAAAALESICIRDHRGAHPRFGVLDVVPFVALRLDPPVPPATSAPAVQVSQDRSRSRAGPSLGLVTDADASEAVAARDRFAKWASVELGLPCFLYGAERSLPDVRRGAWKMFGPDFGPRSPHLSGGSCAVGNRPLLIAYNIWLDATLDVAGAIARSIRSATVRSLAIEVAGAMQVSCNLIAPFETGPSAIYDQVCELASAHGAKVLRAELVGLAPMGAIDGIARQRWLDLDLSSDKTIETRLQRVLATGSA